MKFWFLWINPCWLCSQLIVLFSVKMASVNEASRQNIKSFYFFAKLSFALFDSLRSAGLSQINLTTYWSLYHQRLKFQWRQKLQISFSLLFGRFDEFSVHQLRLLLRPVQFRISGRRNRPVLFRARQLLRSSRCEILFWIVSRKRSTVVF